MYLATVSIVGIACLLVIFKAALEPLVGYPPLARLQHLQYLHAMVDRIHRTALDLPSHSLVVEAAVDEKKFAHSAASFVHSRAGLISHSVTASRFLIFLSAFASSRGNTCRMR